MSKQVFRPVGVGFCFCRRGDARWRGTPLTSFAPDPPSVSCVPAMRELVSSGPLPLPVSAVAHARASEHLPLRLAVPALFLYYGDERTLDGFSVLSWPVFPRYGLFCGDERTLAVLPVLSWRRNAAQSSEGAYASETPSPCRPVIGAPGASIVPGGQKGRPGPGRGICGRRGRVIHLSDAEAAAKLGFRDVSSTKVALNVTAVTGLTAFLPEHFADLTSF